jgi:hypothetical protein
MRKVIPPPSYPAPCFSFFFFKPLPRILIPFCFFWVGQAHGHVVGAWIFHFLFLVSHLLNRLSMWDLLLVPHWWKKKKKTIHPNPN